MGSNRAQAYERGLPAGTPGLPSAPPAPLGGFEPPGGRLPQISQSDRQRAATSWAALRQRISLGLGPTADRWSTYPGDGLTPERIVQARKQAHAGYPWMWCDLVEQEMERNAVIKGRHKFRTSWVHQVPWRIDAPDHFKNDVLANKMAAWATALINGLRNTWPNAMENLLAAPAYGWAAAENFWDWRDIAFTFEGKDFSVPCWAPVSMKEMHQRRFIFDIDGDDPLLWDGQGRPGLKWAKGKILFHRDLGIGITERRGYMTAAIWLAWALQAGWRDLIIFMHLYGLPQFALMLEEELLQQAEMRDLVDAGMDSYGQGKIPIWPKEAEVAALGQVQGEPLHPAVINLAENHLSVLITGSVLAQTQGTGTGSYNAGDNHAITAHLYRVPDGIALDRSIGDHLLGPAVEFNVDALCHAFKATPEQIRQRVSWFGWKVAGPAPTVADHVQTYKDLNAIGFPTSAVEISQRTGCAIGTGEDRIGPALGAPTAGAGGAAGAGLALTEAQQGAIVQANEGRAAIGLAPAPELEGKTVAKVMAETADTVAAAAAAEAGQDAPTSGKAAPGEFERSAEDPGVMVALFPPPDLAAQLALEGGEAAVELHVTLAYLGRRSQVGTALDDVGEALGLVQAAQLGGAIAGIGRFAASETSDGLDPFYASVDVPGLAELRQQVVDALGAAGAAPRAAHGLTPHITLAYLDPAAPSPLQRLEAVPVRFTEFYLVIGEERVAFPLKETV